MNTKNKGFTLIEMLVVVLIIGILAAIALPKYQLAADKARYTQAMLLLAHINDAQKRYVLAKGDYATSFYDLDIDMPSTGEINSANGPTNGTFKDQWGSCWLHPTGYGACQLILNNGYKSVWYFLRWDSKYFSSNLRECWVYPKSFERGKRLCKAMTGKDGSDSGNYRKYNFY